VAYRRAAKCSVLIVFLTVAAFLISGSVTASASPRTQQEHPTSSEPVGFAVTLLSPPQKGVSFEPYVDNLIASVKRILSAKLPESVAIGKKGIVVLRIRIQKDGSLPNDAVTLTTSSGKKDMDDASVSAIHAAAPFGPLPEGYLRSSISLRFAFLYNIPLKLDQKSNPAPAL
jgi:TonB family protein